MERSNDKTLSTYVLNLIRGHYDDNISFDLVAKELADFYYKRGYMDLAEYVWVFTGDSPSISIMEVDPLSNICRDMYKTIEDEFGPESKEAKDFRIRLSSYFTDFFNRCKNEGLVHTFG